MGNEASRSQGNAPIGVGASTPPQQQQNPTSPRPSRDPLYHMKLVLRGARGVGKSSLLARLKGRPYVEGRAPTPEIQRESLLWQYKNMDDKIEVEVWDVVDNVLRDEDAPAGKLHTPPFPSPFYKF